MYQFWYDCVKLNFCIYQSFGMIAKDVIRFEANKFKFKFDSNYEFKKPLPQENIKNVIG